MSISIEYVPHAAIDKPQWNDCILQSANGLIYAHTEWLDAMSPGWDALVANNYQIVMPLTWRRKLGIYYLCQPPFTQQLGLFSAMPIGQDLMEAFLRKAATRYRLIEIFLNYAMHKTDAMHATCTNFILPLKAGYSNIQAAYRRDLIKNLARAKKFNLSYRTENNAHTAIELYRNQYGKRLNYAPQVFEALHQLCAFWMKQDKALVRSIYLPAPRPGGNDELLATGLYLKDENRIYNIASTTLPNGRTLEANHMLFDRLIAEFAGQPLMLDFEGSDLPGVARFYQKFNPQNQPFFFWKSNRLPAVIRWWKR